jgi:hypothetical protein
LGEFLTLLDRGGCLNKSAISVPIQPPLERAVEQRLLGKTTRVDCFSNHLNKIGVFKAKVTTSETSVFKHFCSK